MKEIESITFVVPVNDENIFKKNFLSSPLLKNKMYEIISQRGFASASIYGDGSGKGPRGRRRTHLPTPGSWSALGSSEEVAQGNISNLPTTAQIGAA